MTPAAPLLRVPDPLFARALALRAVGIWAGVRAAYFIAESIVAASAASAPAPSPFVEPLVAAGIVLLAGALALVDLRRRGEAVLLANFGVSSWVPFAIGAGVAALLELVMGGLGAAIHRGAP